MSDRDEALQQITEIAERYQIKAEEIVQALSGGKPPDQAERSSGILAKILAYLGGVLVLAGIAIFIGMQWDQFGPAVRVLVTLGVGFAVFIFALGTVVRSRTLLFTSVIALMSFTGYFFRDSLANAFGLIFMGFLLIGLSAFAMSLNRKYIKGRTN